MSVPAGPVPVPRRKAGKEMGRDVTRKRREKRSDDKSDETRPITVTFLVPHASYPFHSSLHREAPRRGGPAAEPHERDGNGRGVRLTVIASWLLRSLRAVRQRRVADPHGHSRRSGDVRRQDAIILSLSLRLCHPSPYSSHASRLPLSVRRRRRSRAEGEVRDE